MRRKLPGDAPASASADGGSAPSEADLAQLSTAISAEEDLGLFVRWAFACGRPEPLLSSLRAVAQDREAEIEELCRAHYGLGGHGGGGRHSMLPTARRAGCHYGLEEFRGWSAFLSATAADPASPNCPSSPPSFTPMSSLPLPSSLIVPHKDGFDSD